MTRPAQSGTKNENLLELGPDLPIEVFTSTEPWHQERIHAIALYCSDGRWGRAFDDFCQQHLRIPRYDRWAVPGGPAWLATGDERDDFAQAAREQLDFLVQAHQLDRVILITHFGCALYAERLQQAPEACLAAQAEDVNSAAAALRNWYQGIRVEGYLAMQRERSLSFHELGVWA